MRTTKVTISDQDMIMYYQIYGQYLKLYQSDPEVKARSLEVVRQQHFVDKGWEYEPLKVMETAIILKISKELDKQVRRDSSFGHMYAHLFENIKDWSLEILEGVIDFDEVLPYVYSQQPKFIWDKSWTPYQGS